MPIETQGHRVQAIFGRVETNFLWTRTGQVRKHRESAPDAIECQGSQNQWSVQAFSKADERLLLAVRQPSIGPEKQDWIVERAQKQETDPLGQNAPKEQRHEVLSRLGEDGEVSLRGSLGKLFGDAQHALEEKTR